MNKPDRRLLKHQAEVKVAVNTGRSAMEQETWFAALAVFFAGVFYFWAYYFGSDLWRVLAGG